MRRDQKRDVFSDKRAGVEGRRHAGESTDIRTERLVEYEDRGGRGFNLATEDCGLSRGLYRRRRGRQIRMAFTRWEAPRRRGDALLFGRRSFVH